MTDLLKDPQDPNINTFALKTYLFPEAEAARYYDCEVSAFRALSRRSDPHLIGFYGNYKQGSTYNILLEYADGGSLEQYFAKTQPPCEGIDITNFWTSLFGILKALSAIHQTSRTTTADMKILNGSVLNIFTVFQVSYY
jgi:serine/threonine protein kinase